MTPMINSLPTDIPALKFTSTERYYPSDGHPNWDAYQFTDPAEPATPYRSHSRRRSGRNRRNAVPGKHLGTLKTSLHSLADKLEELEQECLIHSTIPKTDTFKLLVVSGNKGRDQDLVINLRIERNCKVFIEGNGKVFNAR